MLLRRVAQVLAMALRALLRGLRRVLSDLLAVLERLLPGLLGTLLDLVGELADALVLHARGRNEHAGEESDGDRADREAERVLLGHALGAPRLVLDLVAVRRSPDDPVLDAHDGLLLLAQIVLRAALDVRLVAQGVDGVAHLLARLLYLAPDPVWVFAHRMSSFTVSTVWGAGGVAARIELRPA